MYSHRASYFAVISEDIELIYLISFHIGNERLLEY